KIKGESAPLAGGAFDLDFSSEEPGDFTADRQPQPGPAVLAAGGAVGLLKRLEDQLLLVLRNADAGVNHREGDDMVGLIQHLAVEFDSFIGPLHLQDHLSLLG